MSPATKLDPALIRARCCPDATPEELQHFLHVCEATGLDPLSRQIYAQRRSGKLTHLISIDGARLLAQRTGEYRGQLGPHWCGEDGEWKDVWLSQKPPAAARVGVRHAGFDETLWATAKWASFAPQGGGGLWQKMPDHMLAKCAEMLALRRAFPAELSGLYAAEEMDQAHEPAAKPVRGGRPVAVPAPAPERPMPEPMLDVQIREAVVDRAEAQPEPAEGDPWGIAGEDGPPPVQSLLVDLDASDTGEKLVSWWQAARAWPQRSAERADLWRAFRDRCRRLGFEAKAATEGRAVRVQSKPEVA